ncbi:hypothetical protein PR048_015081 [Dryococelus australis]|uniref:Serpin domain-containing protein n=1 Tax=Dryococelus australis TaxID=614101 RepID=A0ABQ9HG03_9NEOP|nr:hypothetical protein PR048_015081 [Dryococelus australis]
MFSSNGCDDMCCAETDNGCRSSAARIMFNHPPVLCDCSRLFQQGGVGGAVTPVRSPLSVIPPASASACGEGRIEVVTPYRAGTRMELASSASRSESENLQLTVANHIFIDEGFPLREDFLQTATRDFHSGVSNVTFSSGDASAEINSWVAKETRGKITDIVEPVLPAATVMVLANAIYFKSPWLKKFEKSLTNNNTFSVDPTRNVTVPFMYQEDSFLYGSSEELKVKWVELLFKDTNYSLLVVLPNERFGLADVLANLTSSHISGMLQGGSWTGVRLYLPRFNLNSNTKLVSALKELGIRDVFESGLSDLSGISASKEPLSVSDVVQKATMEIDEDGGVASAATVGDYIIGPYLIQGTTTGSTYAHFLRGPYRNFWRIYCLTYAVICGFSMMVVPRILLWWRGNCYVKGFQTGDKGVVKIAGIKKLYPTSDGAKRLLDVISSFAVVEFVALSSLVFLDSEEFRTDHQFLAVIVNKNGNVPLFMATIVDPSVD